MMSIFPTKDKEIKEESHICLHEAAILEKLFHVMYVNKPQA